MNNAEPSKLCKRCNIEKPLTEFHKRSARKDGLNYMCKHCQSEDSRQHRLKHIEKYRERDRQMRIKFPDRVRAATKKWRKGRPDLVHGQKSRARIKYRERYPLKYAAHQAVKSGIRNGTLVPEPCRMCGNTISQAHHPNYEYPLDIFWLCQEHHNLIHDLKENYDKAVEAIYGP